MSLLIYKWKFSATSSRFIEDAIKFLLAANRSKACMISMTFNALQPTFFLPDVRMSAVTATLQK